MILKAVVDSRFYFMLWTGNLGLVEEAKYHKMSVSFRTNVDDKNDVNANNVKIYFYQKFFNCEDRFKDLINGVSVRDMPKTMECDSYPGPTYVDTDHEHHWIKQQFLETDLNLGGRKNGYVESAWCGEISESQIKENERLKFLESRWKGDKPTYNLNLLMI